MSKGKVFIVIALAIIAGALIYIGPQQYLDLEFVKSRIDQLQQYRADNPIKSIILFAAVYIAVTAASIPGAVVLTVSGGAIFGFITATAVVLISATIGATIAFLVSRYLFEDMVTRKMGERVAKIRASFQKEGALYLFSLRLVPVIPFFAINLLMGLTSIKTTTYFIASLLGMAPGSMVFINAGTQLAKLDSLQGLLSPGLIASFLLLAVFPYIAKYVLKMIKKMIKGTIKNG